MSGDIESRVRRLERANRTMLAALGAAVLVIVAMGARREPPDTEFATVTARSVIMKGDDGKIRLRLDAQEDDRSAGIVVNDTDGKPAAFLRVGGNGRPHLVLREEGSRARINASITGGKTPYVQFTDHSGQELGVLP